MNILQKAIRRFLEKAAGFPVWTGNTTDIIPGGWRSIEYNSSSFNVAGSIASVYGSWRVLCQTIGSLPWEVWRTKKDGSRELAENHWSYTLLHDSPNAYMTSMEFREALVLGFCATGNGYAEKVKLGDRVVSLNPLRADLVVPRMVDGSFPLNGPGLVFEYFSPNGKKRIYKPDEIVHFKNFSLDGLRGLSPLMVHAVQHSAYTEQYASNFMRNQGRPSGVLESDKQKPKQVDYDERLAKDWQRLYSGENAGGTAVLWDGMKYKQITISPNDAQYIETKKLNAGDIAAIYGVPLNMLGQSDKTATYASAEQFDIQFAKHTIRPLAARLEQCLNKALFFPAEPGIYCELDMDALLRGDQKTTADVLRTLTDAGILTRNEARVQLRYPERPEADQLTVRSYEIDLNALPKLSAAADPGLNQSDIRKSVPDNHVHVTTPMADDQMRKVIKEIVLANAASKRKQIDLVKAADGTVMGATIIEEFSPQFDENDNRIIPELAKKKRIKFLKRADGTTSGADITEE